MSNKLPLIVLFIVLSAFGVQAQSSTHLEYIDRYKEIAIREMERAGIPASIKLAQGLLESGAGTSDLARRANNHFGIKCGSGWTGKTYYKKDDDYNERGELVESCFRDYRDPESSYIAHSEFLRDPNKQFRYGFLFRLDPTDYKAWARGLKRAGYATSATYSSKLIDIIERYELHRYDELTSTEVIAGGDEIPQLDEDETPFDRPGVLFTNNDVDYLFAREGETLAEIALRAQASVSDLVRYNEREYDRSEALEKGTVIYLQPKRNSFRGKRQWHYVKKGETMFSISQIYGIDLGRLYRRNKLEKGQMPEVGERIKIRGWNVSSPPELRETTDREEEEEEETDEEEELVINLPPTVDEDQPEPIIIEDEEEDFTMDEGFDSDRDYLDITITPIDRPDRDERPTFPPRDRADDSPPTTDTDNGFGEDRFGEQPDEPEEEQPAPPSDVSRTHTVVKGDTLFNISRRYGLSVAELKTLNGLSGNTIFIGQELRVK